jgi:hypothetical protein
LRQSSSIAHEPSFIGLPKAFNRFDWAALAREVAVGIHDLSAVLKRFNLTVAQYEEHFLNNPTFKQVVEREHQLWESALNTPERVKIEAAAMFEQLLPTLNTRLNSNAEPLNHVVEGGKLIAKAAGIGEGRGGGDPAEKYVINIRIGEKSMEIKDVTPGAGASTE